MLEEVVVTSLRSTEVKDPAVIVLPKSATASKKVNAHVVLHVVSLMEMAEMVVTEVAMVVHVVCAINSRKVNALVVIHVDSLTKQVLLLDFKPRNHFLNEL